MIVLNVVFMRREIGEGDWEKCTVAQYEAAQKDPQMDTKIELQEPIKNE